MMKIRRTVSVFMLYKNAAESRFVLQVMQVAVSHVKQKGLLEQS